MIEQWQSKCSKETMIARSEMYSIIRDFFKRKKVLEVETPLLSKYTVTDPYINSFEVTSPFDLENNSLNKNKRYLQTSPEFAMKRLLCSDIGSIFQICKSFRAEESGKSHNIEFTMLEWYRINFDLDNLMSEMAELLCLIFNIINCSDNILKITYRDLFLEYLKFDYNKVDVGYLKNIITKLFGDGYNNIIYSKNFSKLYSKDDLLTILLSDYIEPRLNHNKIIFLYDYPSTQAALSRIDSTLEYPVAKRFEVYYKGLELANGFHELADPKEQLSRFKSDINKRQSQNSPILEYDRNLISALESNPGLPDCSGVALGLDRVLMTKLGIKNIDKVLSFI